MFYWFEKKSYLAQQLGRGGGRRLAPLLFPLPASPALTYAPAVAQACTKSDGKSKYVVKNFHRPQKIAISNADIYIFSVKKLLKTHFLALHLSSYGCTSTCKVWRAFEMLLSHTANFPPAFMSR